MLQLHSLSLFVTLCFQPVSTRHDAMLASMCQYDLQDRLDCADESFAIQQQFILKQISPFIPLTALEYANANATKRRGYDDIGADDFFPIFL